MAVVGPLVLAVSWAAEASEAAGTVGAPGAVEAAGASEVAGAAGASGTARAAGAVVLWCSDIYLSLNHIKIFLRKMMNKDESEQQDEDLPCSGPQSSSCWRTSEHHSQKYHFPQLANTQELLQLLNPPSCCSEIHPRNFSWLLPLLRNPPSLNLNGGVRISAGVFWWKRALWG